MPAPPELSDPATVSAMAALLMISISALECAQILLELLGRRHLLDACEAREGLDHPKAQGVDGEPFEDVEERNARENEHDTHDLLHQPEVPADALHEREEGADGDGGEDERDAEPE